ncbi:MAG: hypothetical protein UZ17_ACD001000210 [Acidobacteria bacterium OLB17]|nr:MAG: hypothetical protein UZ17_ACD001000210 [Acidobacteria bacterium OLB17]
METGRENTTNSPKATGENSERGSAIVIALFVLALVSVFAAMAMTRTAAEAAAVGNETAEARTFYAAQGSLESMTRNFNKLFGAKLSPTAADITKIENVPPPGLAGYTFAQTVGRTSASENVVLTGGPYSGLIALRDNWQLVTTTTDNQGVQVQLTRNILNNRIPIFQFGIFYDDDLELFRPPLFSFGGRVHSNGNFFISPGSEGVYFDSRVTAHKEVVTQTWRNGYTGDSSNSKTYIKNASGVNKRFYPSEGSVWNSGSGPNVFASNPDMPPGYKNPNWLANTAKFDGNLQAHVAELRLPLKVSPNSDLIDMIKRGKEKPDSTGGDLVNNAGTVEAVTDATKDDAITKGERYSNKNGIRISLADSKAKLPGCALSTGSAVTGPCGIRLDGNWDGSAEPNTADTVLDHRSRGYDMNATFPMTDGYRATRVNGERLYTGDPLARQVWIKVETVAYDSSTGVLMTRDITAEFLSLGVTEESPIAIDGYTGTKTNNGSYSTPSFNVTATSPQPPSTYPDSRSIIKLQRFAIRGEAIPNNSPVSGGILSYIGSSPTGLNYVRRYTNADLTEIASGCQTGCTADDAGSISSAYENYGHLKLVNGTSNAIVPFPIEMFDAREGLYYDQKSKTYYSDSYYDNYEKVARNGVMSMVDIDVANLRRFLRGDFDSRFPTGTPFSTMMGHSLTAADVPQESGWVLYVSDRRGDANFNGKYDMEDVYGSAPGNDGVLQKGEDVDPVGQYGNGILDVSYGNEAARYRDDTIYADAASVNDHKYYRRGVRLINGTTLPGNYDSSNSSNTRGLTVASENGIYVWGNYNATGVVSVPSTGNTPYYQYLPFNTALHIPASIAADAVTILSNAWNDGESFRFPFDLADSGCGPRCASDTTIRFAMLSGDTIASHEATPNQGGMSPRLNGGVHNFKRFLEHWTGENLNYAGSLINLFNSRNNNGAFKCCDMVYDPPRRNWVFDSTFLDPTRLPPATPFFQYVQTTGFRRTNN